MAERPGSIEAQFSSLRAELARVAAAQDRLALAQRRTRAALASTFALAAGTLITLFAGPAESRATGLTVQAPFKVVGRGGAVLLRVGQNGAVELNDPTGLPVARIVSSPEGRGLEVVDPAGKAVGLLGTAPFPDGEFRGLLTLDPAGVLTTVVGQHPLPGGVVDRGLFFYRQNGTIGGTIAHNPVLDADGVVLADAAGQNSVVTLGIDFPINSAGLVINNLALNPEVRLGATPDFGLFQLFDSEGNLLFQQPPIP